jgi:hypothetical protein
MFRDMRFVVFGDVLSLAFVFLLVGCVSMQSQRQQSQTETRSAETVQVESRSQSTSPAAPQSGSSLSYALVTSRVKKGVTTQANLIELFGAPNITTMDADGNETWVYERTASESEVTTERSGTADGALGVRNLDLFFGLGYFGTGAGAGKIKGESVERTKVSHSIKTLTVIVKFNKDKTVKEYSARAAQF